MTKVTATATVVCLLALTASQTPWVDAAAMKLGVSGRPGRGADDPPEVARVLARADARRRALERFVARLGDRADIKALNLTPAQLDAFTLALMEVVERASDARSSGPVDIAARVDEESAAAVINGLRKDQDVTFELVEAGRRMQRLHSQLDERVRQRADAEGNGAARLLQEQLQIAAALDVTHLIARAYAALARTQPVTVGGRAIPAAGHKRARELADLAMARSPDAPDAHYLMGDVLVESEQVQAAEAAYRRALGADAPSSVGRTKLAAALRLQGRMSDALLELEEAQRIDPTYARAHSDAGMILRAEQQLPAAIGEYREAVRLDPDLVDAHNGLAMTLANSGELEEAAAEFREIIRIDPDSTIGYYNLAHALASLDRDVESAGALREVVRIYPDHYNAHYDLGELFRLEGKYDDAATQFREYLRLAPDAPQNQRNITRATGLIRQFEDPNAPLVADPMKPKGPR